MSYHQRIMNMPAYGDVPFEYKEGHRDARHSAAEVANEADAEVERLQARVRELEAPARALVNHLWTAPEPVTSGDLIRLLRTLGDVLDSRPLAAVSADKEGDT